MKDSSFTFCETKHKHCSHCMRLKQESRSSQYLLPAYTVCYLCLHIDVVTWTPRMPKMMKKVQQMRTILPMGRRDDRSVWTTSLRPGARLITLQTTTAMLNHQVIVHHTHWSVVTANETFNSSDTFCKLTIDTRQNVRSTEIWQLLLIGGGGMGTAQSSTA